MKEIDVLLGGRFVMIIHCNMRLRSDEILFLYDNDKYIRRKLYFVNECPVCQKPLAMLVQTRISDNKKFKTMYKKEAALKAFEKYLQETNYKSTDVPKISGETFGLCYGEYTEQRRNGKVVKIKEKAKDFFGNAKVLKVINT